MLGWNDGIKPHLEKVAAKVQHKVSGKGNEMPVDKSALKTWLIRLRDILNSEWTPIPGCPPDEYDTYRDALAAMVRDSASDEELLAYLDWAERESMGLSSFARDRGLMVIASLRKLGPIP